MEDLTDHERLVLIDYKLDTLIKGHDNHLAHHFKYNLVCVAAVVSAMGALVVSLLV